MKPRFYFEKSCKGASEDASVREALKTFSGVISEPAAWSDIPAHSDPDLMDALDKQAKSIDSRTRLLRIDAHEALRRSYAEAGYQLASGSFEAGGAVTTATEVLLYEANGQAYAWEGALPKVIPPASSPASTGGVADGAWRPVVDITLRAELAAPSGAGLVGGLMTPITATSLAGGAVAGQDSTAAIQAAGTIGGTYWVPKGVYIVSSALITASVTFVCERGAVFKRAPGLDINQSYWNPGVPMFDVVSDSIAVAFIDPIFDGNKANQPVIQEGYSGPNATREPAGWAFRYKPVNPATATDCRFTFIRPKFKEGTSGYLLIRGDDVNRRFKTEVVIDEPVFTDTVYGYGKGDPSVTALGWSPDYMQILDYVQVYANNLDMGYFSGATPVGQYAPVGIRMTYSGSDPNLSGGSSLFAFGRTRIYGLGRKDQNYNGTDYTTNNGIGVIDGYGNAESIYIENVEAENSEAYSVRAKASIKTFTLDTVKLTNCIKGINVSPPTGTPCEAVVNIGSITSYGGDVPLVTIVGTSPSDKIRYLHIGAFYQFGATTNNGGLAANSNGLLTLRNIARAVVESPAIVGGSPTHCITIAEVDSTSITNPVLKSTTLAGVYWDSKGDLRVDDPIAENLGGPMISGQNSGVSSKLIVTGGHSDTIVDYAVLNLNTAGETTVMSHKTANISGQSRGFYGAAGAQIKLIGNVVGSGVTLPNASAGTAIIYETGNSWNPSTRYGTSGLTTVGTAKVGDLVYNTAPVAGGTIGWVCVTAGTPGVWKTFGAITA